MRSEVQFSCLGAVVRGHHGATTTTMQATHRCRRRRPKGNFATACPFSCLGAAMRGRHGAVITRHAVKRLSLEAGCGRIGVTNR
jgi:hypothetical protein